MDKPLKLIDFRDLQENSGVISEIVGDIDKDITNIAHQMAQIMYDRGAIGIAAPQVGVNKRIVVIDCTEDKSNTIYLINPEIIWESPSTTQSKEACLSYPGLIVPISRPNRLKVRGLGLDGEAIEFEAVGLWARCVYHEVDHLDGIPFIYRASRQVRRHLMKNWLKHTNMENL
jgi:peptide deformylase